MNPAIAESGNQFTFGGSGGMQGGPAAGGATFGQGAGGGYRFG